MPLTHIQIKSKLLLDCCVAFASHCPASLYRRPAQNAGVHQILDSVWAYLMFETFISKNKAKL